MKTKIQTLTLAGAPRCGVRRTTRRAVPTLIALLLALPAVTQAQVNYAVDASSNTAYVTNSPGASGNITIASNYEGYPVTSIGDGAFANCSGLTSVMIPNSVTSIGIGAFALCNNLVNVTIGAGITSIDAFAFNYCFNLTGIYFDGNAPTNALASIPSLRHAIVYYLSSTLGWSNTFVGLPTVMVDGPPQFGTRADGLRYVSYVSDQVEFTLVTEYVGSNSVVVIPSLINDLPVTGIAPSAFYKYSGLTSVTIPDSVTSIGEVAFSGCEGLTNISIGNGVATIGDAAFEACYSLTSVSIPASVTNIGDEAFGSPSLTSVFFAGNAPNFSGGPFSYYAGDPVGALALDPATIYYLSGTIGWSNTFAGLSTVMLNAPPQFGATDDGWEYVSDGTQIIMAGYTGSESNVMIPPAIHDLPVAHIGNYAFESCTSITNVTIPNSVISIGDATFAGTTLTSVTIGSSVTSIGDYAFYYDALTGVTIPNSVTHIGDYAFEACPLTSVTIGNAVSSIGDFAFSGCLSLKAVYFNGNAPAADSSVFSSGFYYDDPATAYYLPGTLGWDDFSVITGLPTALWFLPQPLILTQSPGFGVQSNQFGFTISWATNVPVVVEACSNLSNPTWLPVSTNTLVGGTSYFSDPQSANLPGRYYRLRSP